MRVQDALNCGGRTRGDDAQKWLKLDEPEPKLVAGRSMEDMKAVFFPGFGKSTGTDAQQSPDTMADSFLMSDECCGASLRNEGGTGASSGTCWDEAS